MLAGRYSYTGAILSALAPDVSIGYWDYQARASYDMDEHGSLTLFTFGAYDFLSAADDLGVTRQLYDVTFHRLDVRYDRQLGRSGALRFAVGLARDRTDAGDEEGELGASLQRSGVDLRFALSHSLDERARVRAGAELSLSRLDIELDTSREGGRRDTERIRRDEFGRNLEILPPVGVPQTNQDLIAQARRFRRQEVLSAVFSSRNDLLGGVWIDLPWQVGRRIMVTPGMRVDLYRTGAATGWAPEPRLDVRVNVTPHVALRQGVGLAHQPPSFVAPVPGLIGSVEQGLQRGVQSHAGVDWRLPFEVTASLTLFQNVLFNGSDALGLFQLQRADPRADASVERVTGHAYGAEIYLRRALTRRLGGFLAYTWSRTQRTAGKLQGPSAFDRRHVLNVALAYDLGRRWRLGGRAVIYSGAPAEVAYPELARRPPRGPGFLRLDWRLEKSWPLPWTAAFWSLVIEIQNTTLARETLDVSCYAYGCSEQAIGPVTIPSVGVEARF